MKYESILDYEIDNFDMRMLNNFYCGYYQNNIENKINKLFSKFFGNKVRDLQMLFSSKEIFTTEGQIIYDKMYFYENFFEVKYSDIPSILIIRLYCNGHKFTQEEFDKFLEYATYKKGKSYISTCNYFYKKVKNIVLHIMFNYNISNKQIDNIISCFDTSNYNYINGKMKYKKRDTRYYKSIGILNNKNYRFTEAQVKLLIQYKCPYRYLSNSISSILLQQNIELPLKLNNISLLRTNSIMLLDTHIGSLTKEQLAYFRPYEYSLNTEVAIDLIHNKYNISKKIFHHYNYLFCNFKQVKTTFRTICDYNSKNCILLYGINNIITPKSNRRPYQNLCYSARINPTTILLELLNDSSFYDGTIDNFCNTEAVTDIINKKFCNGIYCTQLEFVKIRYDFNDLVYYLKNCVTIGHNTAFIIYDFCNNYKLCKDQVIIIFEILKEKNYVNYMSDISINVHINYYTNLKGTYLGDTIISKLCNTLLDTGRTINNTNYVINIIFLKLIYIIIFLKTGVIVKKSNIHWLLWEKNTGSSFDIDNLMKNIFVNIMALCCLTHNHAILISNYDLTKHYLTKKHNREKYKIIGDFLFFQHRGRLGDAKKTYSEIIISEHRTQKYDLNNTNTTYTLSKKPLLERNIDDVIFYAKYEDIDFYLKTKKIIIDVSTFFRFVNKVGINRFDINVFIEHINIFIKYGLQLDVNTICMLKMDSSNLYTSGKLLCNLNANEKYYVYFLSASLNDSKEVHDLVNSIGNIVILRHICNYETYETIINFMAVYNIALDNYCIYSLQKNNNIVCKKFGIDYIKIKSTGSTLIKKYCPKCRDYHSYIVQGNKLCNNEYCCSYNKNGKNIRIQHCLEEEKETTYIKSNHVEISSHYVNYMVAIPLKELKEQEIIYDESYSVLGKINYLGSSIK